MADSLKASTFLVAESNTRLSSLQFAALRFWTCVVIVDSANEPCTAWQAAR